MRTDNPSRVILMIALAALLTALFSCDKPTLQESAPEVPPNYYLSFNGQGIALNGLKNTEISKSYVSGLPAGWLVKWDADSLKLQICIISDTLPTYATGILKGNTFLMNCDSSYLNICNGSQNTPVHYEIRKDTTQLH